MNLHDTRCSRQFTASSLDAYKDIASMVGPRRAYEVVPSGIAIDALGLPYREVAGRYAMKIGKWNQPCSHFLTRTALQVLWYRTDSGPPP